MSMDAETPLIRSLEARLNAFLRDEVNFVLWQAKGWRVQCNFIRRGWRKCVMRSRHTIIGRTSSPASQTADNASAVGPASLPSFPFAGI